MYKLKVHKIFNSLNIFFFQKKKLKNFTPVEDEPNETYFFIFIRYFIRQHFELGNNWVARGGGDMIRVFKWKNANYPGAGKGCWANFIALLRIDCNSRRCGGRYRLRGGYEANWGAIEANLLENKASCTYCEEK